MGTTIPVVIDCDTGVDDSMALFYGLLAPEIEVVAIGTVWGNVEVEKTTANTLRLLEIAGAPHIPVAQGASLPLLGPLPPVGRIHGSDGQGNSNLPPPTLRPTGETASAQIVRLARERPGELTLVPVGPFTNVALALAEAPEIAQLYKAVVLMGGAYGCPGNMTPTGEANIAHDPEAAQKVFAAGWPIVGVGLDVTNAVMLSDERLQALDASGTPAGRHLYRITRYYLEGYAQRTGHRACAMHDALTLAIAADPSLATRTYRTRVEIELTGTHTRGMSVADLRQANHPRPTPVEGANADVVLAVDRERFIGRFMRLICGDERA